MCKDLKFEAKQTFLTNFDRLVKSPSRKEGQAKEGPIMKNGAVLLALSLFTGMPGIVRGQNSDESLPILKGRTTAPGQQPAPLLALARPVVLCRTDAVTGFVGKGLVNSFLGGDGATGTLTSPRFKIDRKFVSFLIGGGGFTDQTCMNLVIDGKRRGPQPGRTPSRAARGTDAKRVGRGRIRGKTAYIEIIDAATGGWDTSTSTTIVFTDRRPPLPAPAAPRGILIKARLLFFPVKTGAARRHVTVAVDGKVERWF